MARLLTLGFEQQQVNATAGTAEAGITGTPVITTTAGEFRSGAAALKCTTNATQALHQSFSGLALVTTYFIRAYLRFSVMPTAATTMLLSPRNAAGAIVSARITSAGKLQLWRDQLAGAASALQLGSDSAATLTTGTWYRIELSLKVNGTSATDDTELLLDGVSVASSVGAVNITDAAMNSLRAGHATAPGAAGCTCFVDDVAVNDSTGTDQNSWPGEGSIVALRPASDSARAAGWLTGAGGTTNLFDAVDNVPPVGVAAPTATSQISNAVSTTTENYDAVTGTYTAAGVTGTVKVVQVIAQIADSGTAAATVAARLNHTANPASGAADVSGLTNAAAAVGASPAGWQVRYGPVQYNPTVTPGTGATVRIGKNTASTTALYADYLALLVEYAPGGTTAQPPRPTIVSQAVQRASVR